MQINQSVIWLKKIFPWMLMSFGMLSGISIVFFIVIVEELLKGRNIGLALLFIASSLFSGLLAIRPRVVRFELATGRILVSWGYRHPWVYARYQLTDWESFDVKQIFPVAVVPSGSSVRTTSLPPYWQLRGKTKKGRSIEIGNFSSENEALAAKMSLQS